MCVCCFIVSLLFSSTVFETDLRHCSPDGFPNSDRTWNIFHEDPKFSSYAVMSLSPRLPLVALGGLEGHVKLIHTSDTTGTVYHSSNTHLFFSVHVTEWEYSKTSDSGHSEIGTQYNKPLNKGHSSRPQIIIGFPIVLVHFKPPRRGQPLYKGQSSIIYIGPEVSFVRRF